ncbi:predicted protein [Postia placenta Mad-698-R]|uniref:Enoyl reductase (ER) domain-containing protein n=1 Tax=Postia placenta MAD-698-R-SB12 TaxID=670580 RepID=A0A1X6MQH0_9APHY|nr:hypothetical protein POSPLADRAFT_1184906 [Postia placenta MAD-698-R-SB12]EED79661.1 predicted protein [Postia placenta Mad-698-R]OSX58529.1 hypothetical protein POSPLADRAFT_1184906 [Postia placenta MAD-698-R-SB12]
MAALRGTSSCGPLSFSAEELTRTTRGSPKTDGKRWQSKTKCCALGRTCGARQLCRDSQPSLAHFLKPESLPKTHRKLEMPPIKNGRVLFNETPTDHPVPGRTTVYDGSQTIDPDMVPLNGGFLVKTLVVSIEPLILRKMNLLYVIGQPISNFGVGVVLRSEDSAFKPGDHVYSGDILFQEYFVATDTSLFQVLENKQNLPWSVYVGVCGMPGQTAHHGWREFAHAPKGKVAFVSSGAGPVEATVIQLAKQDGLKVIASAGSDEKVEFVKSLGADVAFNYKKEQIADVLQREGPTDIYWDNVGGETLEAAINAAAIGGRFIECGMVSGYNKETPYPVKNLMLIVVKELQILGFLSSSLQTKHLANFYREIPPAVARGEIKYFEDRRLGLENVGETILDMLTGQIKGKSVIVVSQK